MVDDQELLVQTIKETYAKKRRELSRPVSDTAPLIERLAYLDRRKEGYWDLAADGDISRETMRRKVAELDTEREALERALNDSRHRDERLEALDRQEQRILFVVKDGMRTFPEPIETENGTLAGLHTGMINVMWSAEKRRDLYLEFGLRIEIEADGQMRIDGTFAPPPTHDEPGEGVADRTLSNTLCPPAAATSSARFA